MIIIKAEVPQLPRSFQRSHDAPVNHGDFYYEGVTEKLAFLSRRITLKMAFRCFSTFEPAQYGIPAAILALTDNYPNAFIL